MLNLQILPFPDILLGRYRREDATDGVAVDIRAARERARKGSSTARTK